MFGWLWIATILGVRIHCEQSNVGNVLDSPIMWPPIKGSFSARMTSWSSASSRAVVIPAMPPPTTSTLSTRSFFIASNGSSLPIRFTAPSINPLALRVASTSSGCTQLHCSLTLVISSINGLRPAFAAMNLKVSRCNFGEHEPIATLSTLPSNISCLIWPCPALLHK
ncbi:MAG: hypothetical protein C5S43_00115 [Candidatus Methanocomedens sp.]|nr:MAG: hypothetical protein C5S43_00115 [ANME-2 cluster archaeon]